MWHNTIPMQCDTIRYQCNVTQYDTNAMWHNTIGILLQHIIQYAMHNSTPHHSTHLNDDVPRFQGAESGEVRDYRWLTHVLLLGQYCAQKHGRLGEDVAHTHWESALEKRREEGLKKWGGEGGVDRKKKEEEDNGRRECEEGQVRGKGMKRRTIKMQIKIVD